MSHTPKNHLLNGHMWSFICKIPKIHIKGQAKRIWKKLTIILNNINTKLRATS